ncbi:MAG: Na+/H+ antiporter NhaA [Anaerolineae bacterium]
MSNAKNTLPKGMAVNIISGFQEFFRAEASGGILLLISTALALIWANSPWGDSYSSLWQTSVTLGGGSLVLTKPLILWINDGLMAIFFLLVGLEIKREVLAGELAALRRAALPISAALGGVVLPALIFTLLNGGTAAADGWAVPIATDIAFALGIMALLGDRVPTGLKIFLTALAIVDDITAVVVIALFYTAKIDVTALVIGLGCLAALIALNRLGTMRLSLYILVGIVLWIALLKSGVHATVAGVLLAMTIPAGTTLKTTTFVQKARQVLDIFTTTNDTDESILTNALQQDALHTLEKATTAVQAPLLRLEHSLHPWVVFLIMPVFALANAGVKLEGDVISTLTQPLTLGIVLGLVIGKPLGITVFSWLAVRAGLADKPQDITWLHIHGAAWLGGIGFTMSLFIAGLAFGDGVLLPIAKTGILVASLIAGVVGWFFLRTVVRR